VLIAVAKAEHLPEWLFPSRTAPFSGASLPAEYLERRPEALCEALGGTTSFVSGYVPTHCGVGFPHDAIGELPQFAPEFVAALADLPDDKRWRVARDWATAVVGRRPIDAQLAQYKAWLRELSAFAQQVVANGWLMVWA
jgi:hypothetical protein